MPTLSSQLIAHFIALDVELMATRARLQARTDSHALHDLRIVVRRLRSRLRPLRGLPGIETLEEVAAELGHLSTPLRDLEVLIVELERRGQPQAAAARRQVLELGCARLLGETALVRLEHGLAQLPGLLRESQRQGLLKGWRQKVHHRLLRLRHRLEKALADPEHDRHHLRLLVKRVRYAAEVWPGQLLVPTTALKAAQSALGDWHDRLVWSQHAAEERDLQPCLEHWRHELEAAEVVADAALLALRQALDRID